MKSVGRSLVVKSFDRAAAAYREHAQAQAALADWLADWLPARRKGRALEVGAGPGLFTKKLLPWRGRLLATDISATMCAAGRAHVPEVEWRIMAAEKIEDGPWDWIFCSSMLQWAEDPEELLASWRAQLAPSGRVLAGLFAEGSLAELKSLSPKAAPLAWRSPGAWRTHLARCGLRLLRDEAQPREFFYPNAISFLRSLHRIGAAPERRFSVGRLRRLLRAYAENFGSARGVRATWMFYRFEAR